VEDEVEWKTMNFLQHLSLRLFGHAYLRREQRNGWRGSLPIYAVKCKVHDLVYEDYPHGFDEHFMCPRCWEERTKK
jgi:hypothetical protein